MRVALHTDFVCGARLLAFIALREKPRNLDVSQGFADADE